MAYAPWFTWAQNAILNLRDAVKAWGEREAALEGAESKVRWQAGALGGLLHRTRMELFSLKAKVDKMDAQLQKVDDELKAAKATIDGLVPIVTADNATIASLQGQIAALQAQSSNVSADDLAKLAADADALAASNASAAALLPKPAPAPASTEPAPAPASDPAAVPQAG